ncbi:MAG: hypothetical protein PHC75_03220 [Burkholderiales bacterium]|nr:hypothetical protein [Burkholderiales bacterium]
MLNLKNLLSIITLWIIISSCTVLPDYFGNTKTNQWMGQNKSLIESKNLSQITIPGTYASGSYTINKYSQICHGELISDNNNAQIYKLLSENESLNMQQLTNAFVTIKYPLSKQLDRGVRYFNLSLCIQNDQIFTSNMYLGETFNNINKQILKFLSKHPKEIIIIDLDDNLWDEKGLMSEQNIDIIYQNIIDNYDSFIIKKSATTSFNIGNIMKQNSRILIASNNPSLYKHDEIWHKDKLFVETSSKHWATIKKLTNLQIALETIPNLESSNNFTLTPIYSYYDPSLTSVDEINNQFNNQLIADYLLILPESANFNIIVGDGHSIDAITKFATRNFND